MSNATEAPGKTADEPIAWRLIPLKRPPFLNALVVTALALGIAVGLRVAFIGFPQGLSASSTFFPAYIVIAMYAGARWGWGCPASAP